MNNNKNNNKVLKSKKSFFTINKKVVMFLGFIVVVGAVLGALYGTGVIGSGSNSGSSTNIRQEQQEQQEQREQQQQEQEQEKQKLLKQQEPINLQQLFNQVTVEAKKAAEEKVVKDEELDIELCKSKGYKTKIALIDHLIDEGKNPIKDRKLMIEAGNCKGLLKRLS